MKVLFVSSGNSKMGISSIIKNQGDSLMGIDIELTYFTIKGKGVKGYLKSIFRLRNILSENNYDIIHAHYSLSAFVASLAQANPLVVSLMGSDVKSKGYYRFIIKFFHNFYWARTIVKSEDMKISLGIKDLEIIPNGVNFNIFKPIDYQIALKETKWNNTKKHVLFAANPIRYEKKFNLAKKAFLLLEDNNIELHSLDNVPNKKMPYFFNASDVVLLTSLWEGSPNVIKEAMACNACIVSTDVGDVKDIIRETNGCYIAERDPNDIANKIRMALDYGKERTGRNDIKYLDSRIIANRIIKLYNSILD